MEEIQQLASTVEEDVKERILEVAREKFTAIGYSAVSLDDLAKELRISKKTLYKYFPSKEEILRAVAHKAMNEAVKRIDPIIQDSSLPVLAKLKALMEAVGLQSASISPVILRDMYQNAPAVWKEIDTFRSKRIEKFGELVAQGIEEGCFRKDLHKEIIVSFYTNAMATMVNPGNPLIQHYAPRQIFETVASIIFEGILLPEVREEFSKIKRAP